MTGTPPGTPPGAPAEKSRAGFIAVIGATNAGKSTLVNACTGAKVSIISHKAQTTRTRILGICMRGAAQLVLIDTPGLFEPRRRLDRAMVAAAWSGAMDADMILLLIDAKRGLNADIEKTVGKIARSGRRAFVALNKVDLTEKNALLAQISRLNELHTFEETFLISALKGEGVEDAVNTLCARLPEGPLLFPEDQITDAPLRLLAAEITREQVFAQLHQELPYATSVETETWTEQKDGAVRIEQIIYVERDTQRAIVLGKGGQRIKAIGAAARIELETILEHRVHLFLHVKARPGWADDPARYRDWGLDFNA
ncbi:MAG: GTPase Era [Rhodospirillales bacterium]